MAPGDSTSENTEDRLCLLLEASTRAVHLDMHLERLRMGQVSWRSPCQGIPGGAAAAAGMTAEAAGRIAAEAAEKEFVLVMMAMMAWPVEKVVLEAATVIYDAKAGKLCSASAALARCQSRAHTLDMDVSVHDDGGLPTQAV